MKARYWVLALILLLVGGAGAYKYARHRQFCAPVFSSDYSFMPAKGHVRGRVYLFGSLNVLSGSNFSDELQAKGVEVVGLAVPQIRSCIYNESYANAVKSALNSIVSDVEAGHGKAKSLIGGGSIGGLHAMMGYAMVPRFDGWFASVPVTKLTALEEFKGLPNPASFDPFMQTARLRGSHGLMTWGTADTRVGYRLSQRLYEAIRGPNITRIEYPGLKHETTRRQVDGLEGWIMGQFVG